LHSESIISAKCGEAGELQVRFSRSGDRYAHRILFVDGEQETVILTSVEEDDDDHWPPSPPLQQLTTEDRNNGRPVALLVGMAGRTHWSVSVEPHQSAPLLLFDVACRFHEQPTRLGTNYRCTTPMQLDESGGRVDISLAGHVCRLSTDETSVPDPPRLLAEENSIAIKPPHSDGPLPQTARWTYRIEVNPAN